MGDSQEQDRYEEHLKDVFNSFDATGCGSLSPEELSDLCQSLHLDEATLLNALLHNQDQLTDRVDFDQFKNALILVLSSNIEPPQAEQETLPKPDSPEIQPKFVKGSKRYGRRSTPEFMEPVPDLSDVTSLNLADEKDLEDNYDSAVPRKRERWNAYESGTEEFEAEGQLHLWNPDEPSTPRGSVDPLSARLEQRLHEACEDLAITWDGCAGHSELLTLCEHLGLEINGDALLTLTGDGVISVQEFVSKVVNHNKPPTPSAFTPYRQLKRLHSTQPFDEGGRRTASASALTSSIGMRLFSTLDDGTGFTPAEYILDAWIEEGIENSAEILQALNFDLDEKLSLSDLTMALENELLVTKNGIHQAALASFKAEIRYLLECVDREIREKEKIRADLEKAEKLKNEFATEMDEHHSAIEHMNNLNFRKLEQEHKEKLAALRSELMKEMDQIQQQACLQREELEAEIEKIREDETFLRDHLSISVKENRRLEMELLDNSDKLVEAQSQIAKLQTNLDNIMKDKFGDLDPGSADFLLQEERIKQIRSGYEAQCRELQDRIDELQSELQDFHSLGRGHQPGHKPLSEELESKSPGMESDPGIGSEEVQPFSMSLEAEMMLEHLKEQHLQEIEDLRTQLESKISGFDEMVAKQRATHEEQKASLVTQHQQEIQALQEEIAKVQSHSQELQSQLEQAELKQRSLEQQQTDDKEELQNLQEEEVGKLRQELLEAHTYTADLEEQLKTLEDQTEENLHTETEELRKQHVAEMEKLKEEHVELLEFKLAEQMKELQRERAELEQRLLDDWEKERKQLQESHENELEGGRLRFEKECEEISNSLTEQWQREKTQMDEQNNESLQALLEEEMLRLVREQEEKESKLREQWEQERVKLLEQHEEALLEKLLEEKSQFEQREKRLKEEWEKERLQLEEDYEGMIQDRLNEEKEKLETEREEEEKKLERVMVEERERLEENHREAMKELKEKHAEEREELSSTLDKLRDDIAQERKDIEVSFNQKIREVEDRFSGDQESVAERFQADVLKLEQHYQSELKALTENHMTQQLHWEAETQKAHERLEELKGVMEEAAELERESLNQKWNEERQELERVHSEEIEALMLENKQLQKELDEFLCKAQTKEIELSRQLNELHNRLQESLNTQHELLTQSETRALEAELLLNQTVVDFKQERAELLSNNSELEAKFNEILSISERQITERIELLTERDDLKVKIEELEMLLKQAAVDFEQERAELQENLAIVEQMLKENQDLNGDDLRAERDVLRLRVKELEMGFKPMLNSEEEIQKEEVRDTNEMQIVMEELLNTKGNISLPVEFDQIQTKALSLETPTEILHAEEDAENNDGNSVASNDQEEQWTDTTNVQDEVDPEVFQKKTTTTSNSWPKKVSFSHEGCDLQVEVIPDPYLEEPSLKQAKCCHEACDFTPCDHQNSESPGNYSDIVNKPEPPTPELQFEVVSSLEAFNTENNDTLQLCDETKPQDEPTVDGRSSSEEEEPHHETVVNPSTLEEVYGIEKQSVGDPEVYCLQNNSHDSERDLVSDSDCENSTTELKHESESDCVGKLNENIKKDPLQKLQALYDSTAEENVLLHQKISLLHQKAEILENLLTHNSEKIKTGHQVLEENYSLKVKLVLLMEHFKDLEMKALKMTDLQIRYEDCICENAKLRDQNNELEKRVWILEGRMNNFHDSQGEELSLVEEISKMREENTKLSERFMDLERQDAILSVLHSIDEESESPTNEIILDLNSELDEKLPIVSGLEDSCLEFEKQNHTLRRAITDLQDESQIITERTQAHRSEASRLAEENIVLKQRIAALKEEDLKGIQEQLTNTLERLSKETFAAQKAAENFKKQISKLCLEKKELQHENRMLSQTNTHNLADMENLRQQLTEQTEEYERREAFPPEERNKLAACVSALEKELNKALEDTAQLEKRNIQLSQQLSESREKAVKVDMMQSQLSHLVEEQKSVNKETVGLRNQLAKAQEKVKKADETLLTVNCQSVRLKSDLHILQQERDSLEHEVTVLHKQLQNANDKNHVLEMALHSSGLQSHSKKLYREELSRLLEQEQQLLKQENDRLQAEVHSARSDLVQSREKTRQLDATILSMKQHKQQSQSSLEKALELENSSLKQELEALRELNKGCAAGHRHTELEDMQQENEALKAQMARMSSQLLETIQAQLVGLLPPSPHRIPRGQHRGEDPDNMQDDRERKMKKMEERMKEIELSLHNVKVLFREKVAQLKDQLHKNGKADVLIKDLYVENSQLLKALEITEQRQKIAEKKNYLLEEKISSLNKIVRDLNPSSLSPYHYKN